MQLKSCLRFWDVVVYDRKGFNLGKEIKFDDKSVKSLRFLVSFNKVGSFYLKFA